MDNITHAIVGTAIASLCLKDDRFKNYTSKILLVGLVVTNLPDIDILYLFFSTQLYVEQHRGITHSIFGMLFMVPIGMLIIKYIFRKVVNISKRQLFITSFLLLAVGHVLLDYFTSFGVQLLNPLSMYHYDYTLIFIIDIFVLIAGIIFLYLFYKGARERNFYARRFILFLIVLYSVYAVSRNIRIDDFMKNHPNSTHILYGVTVHPFLFSHISGLDNKNRLVQEVYTSVDYLPYLGKLTKAVNYPYMPLGFAQNALPNNGIYSSDTLKTFRIYQDFAINFICKPEVYGARCQSLKYTYPVLKNMPKNTSLAGKFLFNMQR